MTFLAVGEARVQMSKQPLNWFLMAGRHWNIVILIFDLHMEWQLIKHTIYIWGVCKNNIGDDQCWFGFVLVLQEVLCFIITTSFNYIFMLIFRFIKSLNIYFCLFFFPFFKLKNLYIYCETGMFQNKGFHKRMFQWSDCTDFQSSCTRFATRCYTVWVVGQWSKKSTSIILQMMSKDQMFIEIWMWSLEQVHRNFRRRRRV